MARRTPPVQPTSQSRQQIRITQRLNRRYGLNNIGSTGDSTPDGTTKSKPCVGAVVQRELKQTCEHRLNRRTRRAPRRFNRRAKTVKAQNRSPVKPVRSKMNSSVKRVKQQSEKHWLSITVDPMHKRENAPVQPDENPKNPNT